MSSTLSRSRNALLQPLKRRLSLWVKKRQGDDELPVTLRSRRLYILPTPVGVTFAFVSFAMLLGSMNYNNSMGFALTFLLAATGLVSMHRCHQNLASLSITAIDALPVFAGDSTTVNLTLHNPSSSAKFDITAKIGAHKSAAIDLASMQTATLPVELPTHQRGYVQIDRIRLQTGFPLTLLNTWTWLHVDTQVLVWPKPADNPPSRLAAPSEEQGEQGRGGDETFAGLRDYQPGDSPRLIAWKAYARTDDMMSRQFEGSNASRCWIDASSLANLEIEQALAIMTRWVLDAENDGDHYGLRLPGVEIPPAHGLAHRNRCLDALALAQSLEHTHA
ncbi:MAG: DUF58 domain-containing protein [Pseudomonadota bacterium]